LSVAGPDPDFPYLSETERYEFPFAGDAKGDVVAVGGNLSPGMLLSAYENGIFPWYNDDDPILWQSPDPRFVIFPKDLHISTSMKKVLHKNVFDVRIDYDFASVITACSKIYREGQGGSWITSDMIAAYKELHRLGYAHCAESYLEGQLVGGCYGLILGKAFFGESMFSLVSNASKAAFLTFAQKIILDGIEIIDCQVPTNHLRSLGAKEIDRKDFLALLKVLLPTATHSLHKI
jgi:leucyl/phenylalanyl-tRNA--protein transferase